MDRPLAVNFFLFYQLAHEEAPVANKVMVEEMVMKQGTRRRGADISYHPTGIEARKRSRETVVAEDGRRLGAAENKMIFRTSFLGTFLGTRVAAELSQSWRLFIHLCIFPPVTLIYTELLFYLLLV